MCFFSSFCWNVYIIYSIVLFISITGVTVYMDFLIDDKNNNDLFNTLHFIILLVIIIDSLFAHITIIIARIENNNKNKTEDKSIINKQLLINNEAYTDNGINRL